MIDKDFFALIARMRNAQKEYAKYHDSWRAKEAKSLEKKVDAEIENRQSSKDCQVTLF